MKLRLGLGFGGGGRQATPFDPSGAVSMSFQDVDMTFGDADMTFGGF